MNKKLKFRSVEKKYLKDSDKSSGITLIALVVTIIVLLILAGISISMILGNNGIIERAKSTTAISERTDIIETAKMDILDKQIQNYGSLSEEDLIEILTSSNYNTKGTLSNNGEESVLQKTLTSSDGKYQILVSEIYDGNLTVVPSEIIRTDEWILTDNDNDNQISIGDLVTPVSTNIRSESFYVMDYDYGDVVLLAASYVSIDALSQIEGDEWCVNYDDDGTVCDYWDEPSIKEYVDRYVQKLENEGVSILEGRLITVDEVLELGGERDSSDFRDDVPDFLWCGYNSYWTGNVSEWGYAGESIVVMNEDYGELCFGYTFPDEQQWGTSLRPVIVIDDDKIQF